MNIYKLGCRMALTLALFAGLGALAITPISASAQDHGEQAQDQHQQSGEKKQQSHTTQHPQQSHAARPQQSHAAQPSHAARPQQSRPAQQTHAQPGRTQQKSRPQPGHAQSGQHARPAQQRASTNSRSQQQTQTRVQTSNQRGSQGRANYQFRSQDSGRLRQYYQGGFGRIDRGHRPHFDRGGYIPRTYWSDFQPVPQSLIVYLPAVPPGYAIGYYDGYVVVYDPSTYLIISVLDILQ